MPELPEVETTKRGIEPFVVGQKIEKIIVHHDKLRLKPNNLLIKQIGQIIHSINRRAKYILLHTGQGAIIIHLGMSGTLRIIEQNNPLQKHDHVEIYFANGKVLRYNDPRKFGGVTFLSPLQIETSSLFKHLGPEPLSPQFDSKYLYQKISKRKIPIKSALMDNKVVVGVGNIYANEILFKLGINPLTWAIDLTLQEIENLVPEIKSTLLSSIEQGGTTLKDFTQPDGKPGYFAQKLQVYGKAGQPCPETGAIIESIVIGGRNSFYSPLKQPIKGQAKQILKENKKYE